MMRVILVIILIIVGAGAYFWWQKGDTKINTANIAINTTNRNTNTVSNANSAVNTNVASNVNTAANLNTAVNVNAGANLNTNAAVDTSGWKTYENSTYGYNIKYPTDWKVVEATGMLTEFSPTSKDYTVEGSIAYPVGITGYTGAASDFLSQVSSDKKSSVTINNQAATKVIGYSNSISYVFSNQARVQYLVIGPNSALLNNVDVSDRSTIESMFEAMLRTFTIQ